MGQCYNSIVIQASAEDVWNKIKSFHDLSWAPKVITSVEVIGDRGAAEVGARRKLNNAFEETLTVFDEQGRTFSYSIDDGPGPVAAGAVKDYIGKVTVSPVTATGESFVTWASTFESENEDAVSEFCNPIYQALLGDLAAQFN